MKRILYLHAGAEMYGADKVLLELLKGLDKSEFEPHVLLPNDGVLVKAFENNGIKVGVLDYPILRRKYFNPKGILEYCLSYQKYSKQIVDYAVMHQIDIIHNNTTAVLEGMYIKQKLKLPLVWHVHEIIVKPKLISNLINFFMGISADNVITVSNAVASHVSCSKFIKQEQLKTIYNGVDSEFYKPYPEDSRRTLREDFGISQDAIVLGMIGRVNAWKGQGDFLEAATLLLAKYPNVNIVLVGGVFSGEEWRLDELKQKIQANVHADRILLKDFQDDTVSLYNLFDVFVLPSTNPDPLPTVVLEAMACGKPVVAYKHGGVLEMVEEGINGLFAEVNQPQDMSSKLEELIVDKNKREKFSQESRKRLVTLFSKQAYINNFQELYRNW